MSDFSKEIRYMMLFYYKKGKNTAQTCRKICEVYSADAVSDAGCRSGLFDFVLEILMSKIDLALVGQSLKKSMKFCNWSSKIGM